MLYVIIVVLAAVFIFTVNATAQTNDDEYTSEEQGEKKPIPQEGLQSSLELSNKIAELEGGLSRTKTELFAEQQAGDELHNEIRMLTERIKGLQAVVIEKNTQLVSLKDAHEKYNDVITCYRAGLSAWDNQLGLRLLTAEDRLTISTQLRSVISRCPSL
jgi:septal ring factor EnvC (AmiA/AmiB activator)